MRRCWRSATRSAPAWTSSPTVRCVGRATRIGSRPRSTASTSTIPEPLWIAAATRTRFPAIVGPIDRRHPCRSAISSFCAPTRASRRRSPCRGRSRCPSRPRTTSTAPRMRRRYGVRACGARGDRRPVRRRRRHRPDRRAVHAGAPGRRPARTASRPCSEAIDGIDGTIAVHICFGYAAIIHERPSGYSFLGELASTPCDQVSIETAQSGLDLEVLERLAEKTIILGVLDLSTDEVETPEAWPTGSGGRFHTCRASRLVAAPDCGMKYLSREGAYGKARGAGGRRSPRGAVTQSTGPSLAPPPARPLRSARLGARTEHRAG